MTAQFPSGARARRVTNADTTILPSDDWIEMDVSGQQAGLSELQNINFSGGDNPGVAPDGGTWTLTFDGETTAPIAFNAPYYHVQAAMEALPNIELGDIDLSGLPNVPFHQTGFIGQYLGVDVPEMTADGSELTPPEATVMVTTDTEGQPAIGSPFRVFVPVGDDFRVGQLVTLVLVAVSPGPSPLITPEAGVVLNFDADDGPYSTEDGENGLDVYLQPIWEVAQLRYQGNDEWHLQGPGMN